MNWSPALPPNAWLRWDVASRLLPPPGGDVLEIGCGQGSFGVRLARRYRYLGIDLDETSLAIARARFKRFGSTGELRLGDLSAIQEDERFDLVCAFEVLEHLEDDVGAVRAWADRLRPGGLVMISAPAWQKRFGPWDELAGHYRRYDPPVLESVFRDAGLDDVRAIVFGWPIGYALEGMRRQLARRRGVDDAVSFESRTAASGRLMQIPDGAAAIVPYLATAPFTWLQRLAPGRGTNIIGLGRRPFVSGE
jgi:SAM-dependent methyltransferase